MASYALTKVIRDRPDVPASGWHWESKEAFRSVARRYGAAGHRISQPQ
ncbi:hypothetical protein ACFQ7G_17475 [Streptomyces massasporeus]